MPLVLSGSWARKLEPSQNETMPVGVPPPAGLEATVAVKVTALLDAGFGAEEIKVVVVALACTFCTRVALPVGKLSSPL